jgi:hypothetical protein
MLVIVLAVIGCGDPTKPTAKPKPQPWNGWHGKITAVSATSITVQGQHKQHIEKTFVILPTAAITLDKAKADASSLKVGMFCRVLPSVKGGDQATEVHAFTQKPTPPPHK